MIRLNIIRLVNSYQNQFYQYLADNPNCTRDYQNKTLIPALEKKFIRQVWNRYPKATEEETKLFYNSMNFLRNITQPNTEHGIS